MFKQNQKKLIVSVDIPWSKIKGEFCRVINFEPIGLIENSKVKAPPIPNPYAWLEVECPKLPSESVLIPIFHKNDFKHLWEAFKERGVKDNEEVLVIYNPQAPSNTPQFISKIFEFSMFPKFNIWICRKGLLEKLYDDDYQEKVGLMKFFTEEARPIKEWRPFQEVE